MFDDFDAEVPCLPAFEILADALLPLGALNSPAELHGLLCGHLCAGGRYSPAVWMDTAWELLDTVEPRDRDLDDLIAELYSVTLAQLRDGSMSFELLVPGDESALEQRASALSQWCHGFLSGFGSTEVSDVQEKFDADDLSVDLNETLEDFAAFVQMKTEDEDEQDSEADLFEVLEYVRVATLNIFMDIGIHATDPVEEDDYASEPLEDETLH